MNETFYKIALYGSLLYFAVIVLSFVVPKDFPLKDFPLAERVPSRQTAQCYWDPGLFPHVWCGDQVFAGKWRERFYNLPSTLIMLPGLGIAFLNVKALIWSLLLYAPLFFLAFAFIRRSVRKLRAAHRPE